MEAFRIDRVMEMARSRVIGYSGAPLCSNYADPLSRCDDARQAIRLYKSCISWALLERYPTKDELLSFTSKEVLASNGIYIDTQFDGERIDSHICCVFLNCAGKIATGLNITKEIIPMIYLSEGSNLSISTDGSLPHPIPVELYYGSRVSGDCDHMAIRDYSSLNAADNVGFPPEDYKLAPNMQEDL